MLVVAYQAAGRDRLSSATSSQCSNDAKDGYRQLAFPMDWESFSGHRGLLSDRTLNPLQDSTSLLTPAHADWRI